MSDRATIAPRLVIQRNGHIIARTESAEWPAVRDALRPFAELARLGGGFATYHLTPLSLWNAAATGMDARAIETVLIVLSGAPLPRETLAFVQQTLARVSVVRLSESEGECALISDDAGLLADLCTRSALSLAPIRVMATGAGRVIIEAAMRGRVKLAFASLGYPIVDEIGTIAGAPLRFALRDAAPPLRPYQQSSVAALERSGAGGMVLLPCGAGKTLVGVAAAARFQTRTLVLCPGRTTAAQWADAFHAWTDLPSCDVGVFDGGRRTLYPITIATYQALAARMPGADVPRHLGEFLAEDWGLVIYDEAHMLPADGFRLCASAAMQARRRLGLTATLVREDGRETDVFALVGPVLFNRPWRELEADGWIAPAECVEVRVPLAPGWPAPGCAVDARAASLNPGKDSVVETLLARHHDAPTLVIGGHLDLLQRLARRLRVPLITGKTPTVERQRQYEAFRTGRARVLIVSSVANQGVDLPSASVAIQVSGHFGSRQEEAQRLGRLLRPNRHGATSRFYTLVTAGTREIDDARHRRLFLAEQGYRYRVERV